MASLLSAQLSKLSLHSSIKSTVQCVFRSSQYHTILSTSINTVHNNTIYNAYTTLTLSSSRQSHIHTPYHSDISSLSPSHQYHTTRQTHGLDEFFTNQQAGVVGRAWGVHECRLKSSSELHKLWFVCVKERNMLYTYKHITERYKIELQNSDRFSKVKNTMRSIKVVLGERRHQYKLLTDPSYVQYRTQQNNTMKSHRATVRRATMNKNSYKNKPQHIKEKHRGRKKVAFMRIKPRTAKQNSSANDTNNNESTTIVTQ